MTETATSSPPAPGPSRTSHVPRQGHPEQGDDASTIDLPDAPETERRAAWRWSRDPLACAAYLVGALIVTGRLWLDLDGRVLGHQAKDQAFLEWMYTQDARALVHLRNPFFSALQNAPDGVNLMANVAMQLPGFLLAPVTLLLGANVTYAVIVTGNLALTGIAWYWVLSRHLVASRAAALLGGAFCAFAPGMISHSSGHLHITGQYLVPLIVWRVVALRQRGRVVRDGVVLGLLIAAQIFIGEEILFLTAVACALLVAAYAMNRPRDALRAARAALPALGIAAGVALAIAAYPLWFQFFGPQHYTGVPAAHPADLASYVSYARESVLGSPETARSASNATEESSFFGWPLAVLAVGLAVWLWRDLAARLTALTGAAAAVLSLGTTLTIFRKSTGIPGPYRLLDGLPLFHSLIVNRLGLITASTIGVLLALGVDRYLRLRVRTHPLAVAAAVAVLTVALVPVAPTLMQAQARPRVPAFITSGDWRGYAEPGRTIVPVPLDGVASIRWSTAAGLEFATPSGYFLGPSGPNDPTGRWGPPPRPTSDLLAVVASGKSVSIGQPERLQAIMDLRYWRADAVVLPQSGSPGLRDALTQLLGSPGQAVDDVWVWDVRALTR